MKFVINKNLLQQSLSIAQKAMAARSNMPALTGILFKVRDNKIKITTSNMDLAIQVLLENADFKIEREGECLIPGKLFVDVVRKLNGDEISIELVQDNILRIVSATSDITMNLLDVADYPEQNFELTSKPIIISSNQLKEIIKQTTFATSTVDNKPILTGVNLRIYANKLLAKELTAFLAASSLLILLIPPVRVFILPELSSITMTFALFGFFVTSPVTLNDIL